MTKKTPIEGLFRQEFARRSRGIDGEVWIGAPEWWLWVVGLLMSIVLCCLIYASTATYAKKESVQGRLVPKGGIIRIVARSGGNLTTIDVAEGSQVVQGQRLARLSLTTNVSGGEVGTSMKNATNAELSALKSGSSMSAAVLLAEKAALEKQREFLEKELELNKRVAKNLESRAELVAAEVKRLESLHARGFITVTSLEAKKSDYLNARQSLMQNQAEQQENEKQVDEITSRIMMIPDKLRELKYQSSAQEAALIQKLTQIEAQASENVVAPISGTIAAVPVEVGQTLSTGGIVAVMTPGASKSMLEAELFVPSKAIGFIELGQDVALHFQAFPYQRYGSGRGKVVSISRTVLSPSDAPAMGQAITEPVFRVKVALSEQKIRAYGQFFSLQPGMLLDANIVLERRNLLALFFDPIIAMRE